MLPKHCVQMKVRALILIFFLTLISCGNETLEKNYVLDYDPNHEIFLIIPTENGYQNVKVPGQILFYGHNKDFIIAQQKPRDSIYNENENLVYDEMEEKIFNTRFSNFWIITLKSDSVYGPMNKSKYLRLRDSLKVPLNLILNNSTQNFCTDGQREDVEYYSPDPTIVDLKNLKGNVEKHNIKQKK